MGGEQDTRVYIVGAGPGDPALITVRGLDLLRKADCVLYDALVPVELLFYTREDAELIPVGKRWGVTQEEINRLMEIKAGEGKLVVRLKGGDPFIFGRGGEEAVYLRGRGIGFEVVPGVSAASGVPAYAGIPLTYRGVSSSICIVTCRESRSGGEKVDWGSVAGLEGTLVLFMCATRAREVREKLLSAGLSGETPFSSIRWGTTSSQEVISGRLRDLGERALVPPCITVVGDVVEFRERLSWFEGKPLFGRTILVVRPRDEALRLAEELRSYGARALIFPAIRFVPTTPRADLLRDALDSDWLIFTSTRGVRFFVHALRGFGLDVRAIGSRIAAVGGKTAQELSGYGIAADLVPGEASTAGLLEEFGRVGIGGRKVAILRGGIGNEALRSGLEGLGAHVVEVVLYRTVPAGEREAEILRPLLSGVDTFIFTSPSGVDSFLRAFGAEGRQALERGALVAMGPTTGRHLEEKGFRVDMMPVAPTDEGIIEAVLKSSRRDERRRSPPSSDP